MEQNKETTLKEEKKDEKYSIKINKKIEKD